VIAGLRIDELDVHAHPIAAALNAFLQRIPHLNSFTSKALPS
jgi:hypothetical protein